MSIPSSPGVRVAARAPLFLGRLFDRAHRNSTVTGASRGSGGRAVIGGLRGPKRAQERQRGGGPSRATGCGSDEGDAAGEDRGGPPDGRSRDADWAADLVDRTHADQATSALRHPPLDTSAGPSSTPP